MNNKFVNFLLSLIALLLMLHYYFSFDFLLNLLGKYDLDAANIITWEDVQFTIASINIKCFPIQMLNVGVICYLCLFVFLHIDDRIGYNATKSRRKSKTTKGQISVVLICIFILLIALTVCCGYQFALLALFFLIMLFIAHKYKNKYCLTIAFILFVVFAKITFNEFIRPTQLYNNDVRITFTDGRIVQSDQQHRLIFFGSKYIVLTSNKVNANLYLTKDIQEVQWIRPAPTTTQDSINTPTQ